MFSKNGGLEDVFGPVDVDPAKGMNRFIWQWGPDEHDAVVMSSNLAQVLRNCVNPDSAMLMFRTAIYCSRYNTAFPTVNRETAKDYLVTEQTALTLSRNSTLIAGTDIPVDLTVAIEACREGSMHVTPGLAAVPWNRYLNLHGGRSRYWIDSLVDRDKPGLVATNSRETGENGVVLRALDIRVGTYRERGHIDYILLKDDQTALKLVEKATRRAIELVKHGQPIGINTNPANVYTIEIPSGPDHLIMLDKIIDWEDVLEAVHSATPDNIASARWGIGERVLGMNNCSRHQIAYRLPWKFAGPLTMDPFASSGTSKLPILTFTDPEKRPIAPMEECLARARADWGHDADKMLALATVIQWFHNASTQGKDKSYSNNRYVSRIRRNCRYLLYDPHRPDGRSRWKTPLAEEILAIRYCSPDGSLDASIGGRLCELGLIHLALVQPRAVDDNNVEAKTINKTTAVTPRDGIAEDRRIAKLEDKVQGLVADKTRLDDQVQALTARLQALEQNQQRVHTGGQAVVTEQDLFDAMRQTQVKITTAREEAEAAMDAKLATEVEKFNNRVDNAIEGADEQLAAMQGKIAAMETTIRDLEANLASGIVPGGPPTRPASASVRAPTHPSPGVQNSHKRGLSSDGGEKRPGKRLQGSRNWFPSESDAEDEDSNTHSNQSGEKSRRIWFP